MANRNLTTFEEVEVDHHVGTLKKNLVAVSLVTEKH